MLANSNSSLQSLQRAKLQQHRRFAQEDKLSHSDFLSFCIVVVVHLAAVVHFLLVPSSPQLAAPKRQVIQVELTPAAKQLTPPEAAAPIAESAAPKQESNATVVSDAPPTIDTPPQASNESSIKEEVPLVRTINDQYFTRHQLTEKPSVIEDIENEIQVDIPSAQAQDLRLLLFINEEGSIDKLEILQANLPSEASNILLAKFSRLKFKPGKIDGVAVKSQLMIEVHLEANITPPLVVGGAK